MAEVKSVELVVPQGTTFKYQITFLDQDNNNAPVNMTGWESRLQMRLKVADPDPPLYSATELTHIELGNGVALWKVPATVTAEWEFKKCVFDWEVQDPGSGEVFRLVKGTIELDKEVTR